MGYNSNQGIDFSRLDINKTRQSLQNGGSIVYKDSYYNPGKKVYVKSKTRQVVTSEMRSVIVECIKDKVDDFDVVLSRLESSGLDSVKESYWDMALRAFSYLDINSESDVDNWIESPKDIKSYMSKEAV
jgi:hypothetical protein